MTATKAPPTLRHEPSIDEADFAQPQRKSGVYVAKKPRKKNAQGKGKRSLEDMMASIATDPERASYGLARIAALEDQIANVMKLAGKAACQMIVRERKRLKLYAPEAWRE